MCRIIISLCHFCRMEQSLHVAQSYRINSMYWDRWVSANSADQDQTASEEAVWSGPTLFAILSASFGCINAMLHQTFSVFRTIMAFVWGVPNFRIFMVLPFSFFSEFKLPRTEGGHCRSVQDWDVSWPSSGSLGWHREPGYGSATARCRYTDIWSHTQVWCIWAWKQILYKPRLSYRGI